MHELEDAAPAVGTAAGPGSAVGRRPRVSIGRDYVSCSAFGAQASFLANIRRSGLLEGDDFAPLDVCDLPGDGISLRATLVPNFGFEWPGPMWLTAARAILECWRRVMGRGITFIDAGPSEVMFAGTKPIIVNVNALAPFQLPLFGRGVRSFVASFAAPLRMLGCGQGELARALARRCTSPARRPLKPTDATCGGWHEISEGWEHHDPQETIGQLRTLLDGAKCRADASEWLDYYTADPPLQAHPSWDAKRAAVDRALNVLRPHSVLDMGCNTGWYARLAAERGATVVAVDTAEDCLGRLIEGVSAAQAQANVLPLILDVLDPAPALGFDYGRVPSAQERLKSDLVLALAVVHHLILADGMTFGEVAGLLARWTTRWLLVEFVPLDANAKNPYAGTVPASVREWYTTERFADSLARFFSRIVLVPGDEGARRLILCEL